MYNESGSGNSCHKYLEHMNVCLYIICIHDKFELLNIQMLFESFLQVYGKFRCPNDSQASPLADIQDKGPTRDASVAVNNRHG